uniref:LAM_G_DOMAIN domain-containing protein n=1 Tax=Macrostomum lignano TaxID=282301 RepID=A0A1I8GIJ3_9PLAT
MEPGFCCRNITNFESNCYTTGSVHRNLTAELAAMSADSGVMRLASFSSSAALQNFVTESQRTRVGSGLNTRSKEPLNLAHWLRIGLFYEHRTKKVFYLNCGAEDCKMAEFEDADKLYHAVETTNSFVSCGSLRAVNVGAGASGSDQLPGCGRKQMRRLEPTCAELDACGCPAGCERRTDRRN